MQQVQTLCPFSTVSDVWAKAPEVGAPRRLARLDEVMPGRGQAEAFIRQVFLQRYGAHIREIPPQIMALQDHTGRPVAAAGLRCGGDGPFFLEQYLDFQVDCLLDPSGRLDRTRIIEIGNLAAPTPGEVRYMMIALTAYLHAAGYEWVVCTAIGSLRNTLARMGLAPVLLGPADPGRLGEAASDWGSYYRERPQVIAGHLGEVSGLLEARFADPGSPHHGLWRSAQDMGHRDRIAALPTFSAAFFATCRAGV